MTDTLTQREFEHVAEGLPTTHPKLAVFIDIGPVNAVWSDFVKLCSYGAELEHDSACIP